ncbi:MAG: hybrid sensor histidine kinase/response regulator transcription factor [Cyclobacteriaceae bacterium]
MMSSSLWQWHKMLRAVLLGLTCCLATGLFAQQEQVSFRQLTVQDGLSQNSVVAIAQDSLGFLWFATQDGLNRYDGLGFKQYDISFDDITRASFSRLGKLMVDSHGALWLIPKSGVLERLDLFNDQLETFPELENISSIFEDCDNRFWVGTWGNGLHRFNPEEGSFAKVADSPISSDSIFHSFEDSKKRLWVATNNRLVSQNTGVWQDYDFGSGTKPLHFSQVTEDKNGTVWAGTFGRGLYYLAPDKAAFQLFSGRGTFPTDLNIQCLLVDGRNRIWVGTYGDGAYLIDKNRDAATHYQPVKHNPDAIGYNDVLTILEDRSGTIWLGTDGGGVSFYDENLRKFNVFTNAQMPEDIHIDVIRSILVDAEKSVWLGTSGKGLTKYQPNNLEQTWQTFTSGSSNLPGDRVMSLLETEEGNVWIGTQGSGIGIYLKGKNDFISINKQVSDGWPDRTIWSLFRDTENRYWVGTQSKGLFQLDMQAGLVRQFLQSDGLSSNNIRTIIEGEKDVLWIGTDDKGLNRFNQNTNNFTAYRATGEENAVSHDRIKCLYYDENSTLLWIGTDGGGLNVLDAAAEKFYSYTTTEGLPNNVIYGILPDTIGNLWLSTNRGLCQFTPPNDPSDPLDWPKVIAYDNYDGLQSLEFNTGAYFRDQIGNLYFGGIEGFNWFNPGRIQISQQVPNVVITGIEVFGQPLETDSLIETTKELNLAHNQNALSFTFAALSLSLPEKNRYQYRMVGIDEQWIISDTRNYVNYTNLDPGSYTFQVRGSNYDGVWSQEVTSLNLVINAPWWQRWWAYAIYLISVATIGFMVYSFQRKRWELNNQLKHEHQEAERLKELDEFKSRLYTNITHEFRTPLTVIQGMADQLSELVQIDDRQKYMQAVGLIKRNGGNLLQLINQMLDLAKLESDSLPLRMIQSDVVDFLKYLVGSFQSFAPSRDIELTFVANPESVIMDYDPEQLQKIVSNLFNNAIKFTPDGGKISSEANQVKVNGEQCLRYTVKDNGRGIAPEELPHIFDRFYQAGTPESLGSGIGLALTKELTKLMGGEIQVASELGAGTTFTVMLPITRNASSQEVELTEIETNLETSEPIHNSSTTVDDQQPLLLIIEDNPDVVTYLASILDQDYQLHYAGDGEEGIEKALEVVPDLVVCDVMMPRKDGFEVCEFLKNDTRTSHIPVVMLTAKAEIEDRITGLKRGADAYLAKPFNKEELLISLQNLLELRKKLQAIYTTGGRPTDIGKVTSPLEDAFITKMKEVIESNLSNGDFGVLDLCQSLAMSRTQVHRKLKALTNLSTTHFIRSIRLTKAKELLETSTLNISEIAYEVGFNDPSYFHRTFVQEYGVKPSEMRR